MLPRWTSAIASPWPWSARTRSQTFPAAGSAGASRPRSRVGSSSGLFIDVAFSAVPVHAPDEVTTSNLLKFAGIDGVEVPTLGIEQHLAEKLHAYTRVYSGGRRSTRVKDLVDVVVIANTSAIDAAKLAEAITVIFERRAEQAVPASLPHPPEEWATSWRRLARDVPATHDIADGHGGAAALFDPVLRRERAAGAWRPGKGWVD